MIRFLKRLAWTLRLHPCRHGHTWRHVGGRNCGCGADAACSVPVYECVKCHECDYGYNDEADEIRAECQEMGRSDSSLRY